MKPEKNNNINQQPIVKLFLYTHIYKQIKMKRTIWRVNSQLWNRMKIKKQEKLKKNDVKEHGFINLTIVRKFLCGTNKKPYLFHSIKIEQIPG